MYQYIRVTWRNGREYGFPIHYIIKELIRGSAHQVNVLTEI